MSNVTGIALSLDEARELGRIKVLAAIFGESQLRTDILNRYLYLLRRSNVADRWRAEAI